MGRRKSMLGAAQSRDPVIVYETLLDGLAETFDETKSARDRAQLANRIMDAQDRLCELKGEMPNAAPRKGTVEVAQFEVIASRRTERRKAATG